MIWRCFDALWVGFLGYVGSMKSVVFCSLLIVVFVLYQKEKIGSVPIDCQGSVSKITAVRTLEKAMESGLENTIHHAVSQIRCVFNVVNVERPEEYITTITPQPPLTTEEKSQSLDTMWTAAEKRFWWGTRNKKPDALRIPAEVIMAAIAAQHMPNRDHLRDLKIALDAAEYLLLAQKQAGSGVFGFPLHPRSGSHSEKLIEPFNKKFLRVFT
jgi:hypothetical protein